MFEKGFRNFLLSYIILLRDLHNFYKYSQQCHNSITNRMKNTSTIPICIPPGKRGIEGDFDNLEYEKPIFPVLTQILPGQTAGFEHVLEKLLAEVEGDLNVFKLEFGIIIKLQA
jgi:hypothetical protein